jgi:hypothetical protein
MTQYKAYVPISFLNILTRYIDEQTLEAKSLRKTLHELSKGQRVDTQTFSQLLS